MSVKTINHPEMEAFWKEHSAKADEQEMMLDSNAEELGKEEIPEVLSLLPDVSGLDVVELGAGIGRFTGKIAEKAKSILAVDFMESFVEKNRALNGRHRNAKFMQADVMNLNLPPNSCDLVFSNWLLMYLDDNEVAQLFTNILTWLRPGGYLFFRESCFHQSGNASRSANPTKYRDPAKYNLLLQSVALPTPHHHGNGHVQNDERNGNSIPNGKEAVSSYVFDIIMCRSLQTYIKKKANRNQICWLLHKVEQAGFKGCRTFQDFLDQHQYSLANILRYEWVFGRNFVSPGGLETAQQFTQMLKLKPGETVLDLGCGIGGSAFYMAQQFDVNVIGMDLSANMIAVAQERTNELKENRVLFEIGDATKRNFADETFDAIYSRDTILHIKDKHELFSSCLRWLRPGGRLVVTDYCCRKGPRSNWSEQFKSYVERRGYHLLSVSHYAKLLEEVGFRNVTAVDRTDQFGNILTKELNRLTNAKTEFLQIATEKDYNALVTGWRDKLVQSDRGDHKYASFYAEKL